MSELIEMIPIDRIRVINPRYRDPKKFAVIVESIKQLGLKKPIKVSRRDKREGSEPGYDLVYGQGRIEAFQMLGFPAIPSIVVDIPQGGTPALKSGGKSRQTLSGYCRSDS